MPSGLWRWALVLVMGVGCNHPHAEPTPSPSASGAAEEKNHEVTLPPEALEAAKLSIAKARKGPRVQSVRAAGSLDFDPQKVARVGPLLDGRVVSVQVRPGDEVKPGMPLATLTSLDVGRARADLLAAKAKLTQAEATLVREKKLVESHATSEREVVEAETAVSIQKIEMQAASDRLRAAGAGAGRGAGLALTSPIAGRVLSAEARIGQPVKATDTLFLVGDTSVLWLMIEVYERDLGRVKAGDKVKVSVVARPGKVVEGQVAYVHHLVDPARRVASARVILPNDDGELFAGMSATARILTGASSGEVVSVPRGAIQSVDGQPFVFLELAPGRYEMRAVERGEDLEDEVEIRHGLAGGEPVVNDGSFLLKSQVLREQMGSND